MVFLLSFGFFSLFAFGFFRFSYFSLTACDEAEENGESPKRNIEAFNKFCTSGEAEVRESEETESEEAEETESEENQSEDGTFITISMKAALGFGGATIRIDDEGNVLQADGDIETLLRNVKRSAMPLYNRS